jgi:hypothetical protein
MLQPTDRHKEIADEIYQDFCESEGGLDNHPFQDAWDAYEEKHGSILLGSEAADLVYQAMLYAVQVGVDNYYNPGEIDSCPVCGSKEFHFADKAMPYECINGHGFFRPKGNELKNNS